MERKSTEPRDTGKKSRFKQIMPIKPNRTPTDFTLHPHLKTYIATKVVLILVIEFKKSKQQHSQTTNSDSLFFFLAPLKRV
jgi:hypothetical protein